MSRPMNMLRTRRKDTNVKPNRRLDRKSSRGMIYENEDLRLKTININAEVESRQSDIKKLKRENEMLKKGLWYLRDEYDKLEKLVKDKKIDISSSSTTCSTSSESEQDSRDSFGDPEAVESAQNAQNDQRTDAKNHLHDQFDLLSVVTEETSELRSHGTSSTTDWPEAILRPDQSYPDHRAVESRTPPASEKTPMHFFSPIQTSESFEDRSLNRELYRQDDLYPEQLYAQHHFGSSAGNLTGARDDFISGKIVRTDANCFYQDMMLVSDSLEPKSELRAMEKASTDLIVKLDNRGFDGEGSRSTVSSGGNLEQLLNDIESISQRGLNGNCQYSEAFGEDVGNAQNESDKPFKSELNVVLMPNPMPLIGFDKYRNIQRSLESLNATPLEELSASHQNLCVIPPPPQHLQDPLGVPNSAPPMAIRDTEANPFFFGNFKDNYVNPGMIGVKYGSDNFFRGTDQRNETGTKQDKNWEKANLLDLISTQENTFAENEENLKFKTSKTPNPQEKPKDEAKADKLSIRKKVCIHFKGKKDRAGKTSFFNSDDSSIAKTPEERKNSLWNLRDKAAPPETPSTESKKTLPEPKTPSSSDSKISNEKKSSFLEKKDSGSEKKESGNEKKTRKSSSASPERKHVQLKEDVSIGSKKHRKHKNRTRLRRQSAVPEQGRGLRERSFSVCTDRSNIFGSSMYFDEFSDDRERTNSASSCDTTENARKMSMMPNVPLSGKVPWCGCWGNGCL